MKANLRFSLVALCAASLAACGGGAGEGTRDSVRAVGSSTVYPFAKLVAENFVRSNPDFGSPIIESTGTGGGIELFCQGVGANTPDIANSSRRMKASEFEECQKNGVTEIAEVQVGLDGIAFVEQFRQTPACAEVPILVWTAKDLTARERERLQRMRCHCLTKESGDEARRVQQLRAELRRFWPEAAQVEREEQHGA